MTSEFWEPSLTCFFEPVRDISFVTAKSNQMQGSIYHPLHAVIPLITEACLREYSRGTRPLSIPVADPMESMSEERVATVIPPRPTALPKSSSNKVMPLEWQKDISQSHPAASRLARRRALVKKVIAEFLGTFMLIFIVLSALIMNETQGGALGPLGVAATAGLAMVIIAGSLAYISGGHINPAVSIAMAMFGHLPLAHLVPYVVAQFLGSTAASFAAKALYHPVNLGPIVTTVPALDTLEALFVEFITTFIFLFFITAVATNPKALKELVPVAAGAGVMMSALISGETTGASMNPARTLGPAIATGTYTKIWVYIVAPPLGAIAGVGAYTALN